MERKYIEPPSVSKEKIKKVKNKESDTKCVSMCVCVCVCVCACVHGCVRVVGMKRDVLCLENKK